MKEFDKVLNSLDKTVFSLRSLYDTYGFKQYRMSKFEEYELYIKNKDFLATDSVITFTDSDGKLMALKPDVTLSIIKNGKDGQGVEKVYYNENVYRVSKGTHSFKEFMQVGLECVGDIDDYEISEVVLLALKSLQTISDDYILDISHLAFVKGVLKFAGLKGIKVDKAMEFLAQKNAHGITNLCNEENLSEDKTNLVKMLVSTYGKASEVINKLKGLDLDCDTINQLVELENLVVCLDGLGVGDKVRIDFSVINDMNYYNGIVFNGFVSGIPQSIVSGGQYDNLMAKMNRRSRAIGFAVYLDEIESILSNEKDCDVDVLVEYGNSKDLALINKTVKEITDNGQSVFAVKSAPQNLRYKKLIKIN